MLTVKIYNQPSHVDADQLSPLISDIYILKADAEHLPHLKKGTMLFKQTATGYIPFQLEDDYHVLVWKSPQAFYEAIEEFVNECNP